MKVKEIVNKLINLGLEKEILVACDEEWNSLFKDIELEEYDDNTIVIFGLSGSEVLE